MARLRQAILFIASLLSRALGANNRAKPETERATGRVGGSLRRSDADVVEAR